MKKKISKKEAKEKIEKFFLEIKGKNSREIQKIKRLAMAHNINLKENRKTFCKKCLNTYKTPKTRIRNKMKCVVCENCGAKSRWKIKS